MTRLRIASYRRNRELRKELVAPLDAATRVAVENPRELGLGVAQEEEG
jgi:hypothetical protein